jgi:hypothetical protein
MRRRTQKIRTGRSVGMNFEDYLKIMDGYWYDY